MTPIKTTALTAVLALCTAQPLLAADFPSYYPENYSEIVTAAEAESGNLVIYSSTPQERWTPVFEAFQARYPFVSDVTNLDLEGEEIYQRMRSQAAQGLADADVVEIQPSIGGKLKEEQSLLMPYVSAETSQYEAEILMPYDNGYQFFNSPLVAGYNTAILPGPITTIEQLADEVEENDLSVGMRNISSEFAFTGYNTLLTQKPELWDAFGTLISHSRAEGSSGALNTKLQTGEYAAVVFVAGGSYQQLVNRSEGLLGIVYPADGTVFQGGALSIPENAGNPATAKLFIDFVLSAEGQQAVQAGGRHAIRSGLTPVEGSPSFADILEIIPREAAAIVPYAETSAETVESFTKKWESFQ